MINDFNYLRAINQANYIDDLASDMLHVADMQMQSTLETIRVCWHGVASRQFIGHCEKIQNDILTHVNKLQILSKHINEVARIIRDAEEKAMEFQR